jgi:SAM-dependent methyltransferase
VTVVDLGMSPLCESYVPPARFNAVEYFYPLRPVVCTSCWLVQLEEFVSAEDIFSDYAYFSSYSDTWVTHAREYVDLMIRRLPLGPGSRVIEVASNDGYLLQWFVKAGIPSLGVEPAANVAEAAEARGVPTLVRFFGAALAKELVADGVADLVVANNVLAQVPDLNDFLAGLRIVLAPEGVATLEFPHLLRMLDEHQFDTIYHEHFSYFSAASVDSALARHGLRLFDVDELPTHGGSLRAYVCHADDRSKQVEGAVGDILRRERAAGLFDVARYERFASDVAETKRAILELLIGLRRAGKRIVGYGAPGKGNTLLNYCGIRSDFIEFTVDRNTHKQGLYLPGTRIPIRDPSAIEATRPDYLFVLPWNLKDEILSQMRHIRDWGGQFIIPIPHPQVIP